MQYSLSDQQFQQVQDIEEFIELKQELFFSSWNTKFTWKIAWGHKKGGMMML